MNKFCNYKNYLVNGTFSKPEIIENSFKYYSGNEINGWTFNNGVIINNSKAWGYPIPYPCGTQACSIQMKSSIHQIFTVPKTGKYFLIIYYVGRYNVGNTLNIFLNDKQIYSLVNPPGNSWNYKILELNIVFVSGNKLEIKGTSNTDLSTAVQLVLTDLEPDNSNNNSNNSNNLINSSLTDLKYNQDAVQVYTIGEYGIAPWGKNINFPDQNAKWIWYCQKSNIDSPINTNSPITIQYLYLNKSNLLLEIILNIIIDNECEILLNSEKINNTSVAIGGWTQSKNAWNVIPCKIKPGTNLFEFKVKNYGGPGGLLVSAINPSNNNILFHTKDDWKFVPIKPTPVPSSNLSQSGLISTIDKSFPYGCLTLDGSPTQFVNVGKTITGMNGLSFSCWFKSNQNKSWARIFDFGDGTNFNNVSLYIYENKIGLTIYLMKKISEHKLNLSPNVNNNKWNHIVLTIKPNQKIGSQCTLYLNNNQISTFEYVYPINMVRKNCYIGKSGTMTDNNFPNVNYIGSISNFVMYQKVLNEKEIGKIYMSMINLKDPNLYIYLPFSTNSVLDTLLNNYAGKTFSLPIIKSKNNNENWTCVEDQNKKWINVKMENNFPICMSINGETCIEQETKKNCETINKNPIFPSNPIICDGSKMNLKWCEIANDKLNMSKKNKKNNVDKLQTSNEVESNLFLSALETNMEGETLQSNQTNKGGQILSAFDKSDIEKIMTDGVFKLRVNLENMPPYIKGQNFDINKGKSQNYFYLSVEKLDSNCNIKKENGKCVKMYVDEKKCGIKALTSNSDINDNTYRLVLVTSQYVLDPTIPLGKNSDFTIVKINNQLYLKNVQTGYLPSLYSNNEVLSVYGDMEIKQNSNVNKIYNQLNNTMCDQEIPPIQNSGSTFVKCDIKKDSGLYMITTKNIGSSSPIRINLNKDKTIGINLLSFNSYGFPTKIYSLTSCNFNIETYAFIEKTTNNLGTFLINMVCFEDTQNTKINPKNQLKFDVEIINFPSNYVKDNSIFNIN